MRQFVSEFYRENCRNRVKSSHMSEMLKITGTAVFSVRDRQILAMLCQGLAPKEIADKLEIAEGTAHTHIRSLYRRAGVRDDRQLIIYVMQQPHALERGAAVRPGLHEPGTCDQQECPYCRAMLRERRLSRVA